MTGERSTERNGTTELAAEPVAHGAGSRGSAVAPTAPSTDPAYWDRWYAAPHPELDQPSSFARFSVDLLEPGASVFEIGSGNGRDALFMAHAGFTVVASDPSHAAIGTIRDKVGRASLEPRIRLVCRSMTDLDDRHAGTIDAVYLRFVLHAVPAHVASAGLAWAARNLRPGGLLLAEARSVNGSLYGRGEPAGRDAYIHDGHYRRFLRAEELEAELGARGFRIDHLSEGAGRAVHGDDDPVLIRVVARSGGPGAG